MHVRKPLRPSLAGGGKSNDAAAGKSWRRRASKRFPRTVMIRVLSRTRRLLVRFPQAGTLTATAILLFALIVAVTGAVGTRQAIDASFAEQAGISRAQLALERMTKIQLDEENYIRAYVITRNAAYIASYRGVRRQFAFEERYLRQTLHQQRLVDAEGALLDYDYYHRDWHAQVAVPLLAHPSRGPREIDKRGKLLVDLQDQAAQFIEGRLAKRSHQVLDATRAQINGTLLWRVFWLVGFGALAIMFNVFRWRLTRELEEERSTTKTLQHAFRSEHVALPNCRVGSAYQAASSHLAVGGDVFDVHSLSDRLALLMIADVSGKGIDAAVLTAFIKFTIRGIALRLRDPAAILEEFNRAFPRAVNNPYLFVSMVVGMLDTQSSTFTYASAGHDSAFFRRDGKVEPLSVTGPVIGVMEQPYGAMTIDLQEGDMLVLATDGLTEARDRRRQFLGADGAMRWIAKGSDDPQLLAASLVEGVRRMSGRIIRDDIAVVAVRAEKTSARASNSPSPLSTGDPVSRCSADV